MHELSIARSLIGQVREHAPQGRAVRAVHLAIGPLQMIDTDALATAWEAATASTSLETASLQIERWPARRRCTACGLEWSSDDLSATCPCGCPYATWITGDELLLLSIDVDDPMEPQLCALPDDRRAGERD